MQPPLRVRGEFLRVETWNAANEVLPEVLFEDAERKALAVARLEDVVHRKDVRLGIDLRIEAVAHRREEEGAFEQRQIEIRALALMQRGENRDRGKGAA